MAASRARVKGRRERGAFIAIPKDVLESPQYAQLSAWAVKLLIDIYSQFNGKNNGDLCAAWAPMRKKGWNSRGTLSRAVKELLNAGFIKLTRQGGKHKASLYAVTWKPIDECKGKLEVAETRVPSNEWKTVSLPRMSVNVPRMCVNSRRI